MTSAGFYGASDYEICLGYGRVMVTTLASCRGEHRELACGHEGVALASP